MRRKIASFASVVLLSGLLSAGIVCSPVFAQNSPDVSVVTLQVIPQANGQESVVTPAGKVVPLPGAGVNSPTVQVYLGAQGGCWYVDKYGKPFDLTAYVQQYRSMAGAVQQQVPQYAPVPTQTNSSSSSSSSSSGGGSGLGSTLAVAGAAAGGAMLGSALASPNYYSNVPYGTPVYYPRGGSPYYRGANNAQVNVEHNTNVNANYYDQHSNTFEQQNQWYANQRQQNPQQARNWQQANAGDNPFVRNSANQTAGGEDGARRGRFGGGDDAGGNAAGGRFGRQGDAAGANAGDGGAFGGRRNADGNPGLGDQQGGGRFQNAAGGGGGRFQNREQAGGGGRFQRGGGGRRGR